MRKTIGGLMILTIVLLGFGTAQAESTLAAADALYDARRIGEL